MEHITMDDKMKNLDDIANTIPPFYFCRTAKMVVSEPDDVIDEYFIIDEKCKLSETKHGEHIMVRSKKDAHEYAKKLGWINPVVARSYESEDEN